MYANVSAIVLRASRAGEHNKRLSLFTRERGRLLALAPGAAKPKARLAAATEPGVESRFRLWLAPNQPFARVTGGGVERSFPALRSAWPRFTAATFLCEWTDRLTGLEQPHPEKYDLLTRALAALETRDPALVRLAYLVQFLTQAGYGVEAETLGPRGAERWGAAVEALGRTDFDSFPAVAEPEGLEDRLLKFVAPLLSSPLRTPGHERSLKSYLKKVESEELRV